MESIWQNLPDDLAREIIRNLDIDTRLALGVLPGRLPKTPLDFKKHAVTVWPGNSLGIRIGMYEIIKGPKAREHFTFVHWNGGGALPRGRHRIHHNYDMNHVVCAGPEFPNKAHSVFNRNDPRNHFLNMRDEV